MMPVQIMQNILASHKQRLEKFGMVYQGEPQWIKKKAEAIEDAIRAEAEEGECDSAIATPVLTLDTLQPGSAAAGASESSATKTIAESSATAVPEVSQEIAAPAPSTVPSTTEPTEVAEDVQDNAAPAMLEEPSKLVDPVLRAELVIELKRSCDAISGHCDAEPALQDGAGMPQVTSDVRDTVQTSASGGALTGAASTDQTTPLMRV